MIKQSRCYRLSSCCLFLNLGMFHTKNCLSTQSLFTLIKAKYRCTMMTIIQRHDDKMLTIHVAK